MKQTSQALQYQRNFRHNPAGKFCPCGNPGFKFSRNEWACERCYNFELRYYKGDDRLRDYSKDNYQLQAA